MLSRSNNPNLLTGKSQNANLYLAATSPEVTENNRRKSISEDIKHKNNEKNQLIESSYSIVGDFNNIHYSVSVPTKRVAYTYEQDKLTKASYYNVDTGKPYQIIEVAYDDQPGYLENIPIEARFMPLELPYREHNIVSYKVMDSQGKIRKDLSYTYTYNQLGYPNTFTQKMFDGREVKGYIVYKAVTRVQKMIASAQ